ncbi:putative manganese transporter [Saccharothrix syringae]|uniref:Uncharacterized protein n=1 Tax=Saccharothrix syringae TaxID=103733 RepID=A0A5Q0GVB4_SACSY|nr:putative manganese transporter [Saccharothrix syringae]QFZ17833.1 hypothetical protein EKG83_10375 [Saccharothrix syringae]
MPDIVIRPLADAFMQVGVFVAVLVAAFTRLRSRHGDRLTGLLERRARLGPLIGAALGVSPGCAGALMVMPLYTRGSVSFGTVVAALAATMGDSSWVIFAAQPLVALRIHALLFATGLAAGYLVDAFGIAPRRAPEPLPAPGPAASPGGVALAARTTTPLPVAFWVTTALAAVVAVPTAFQLVPPEFLAGFPGADPYLVLGAAGTVLSAAVAIDGRRHPHRHADALTTGAREVAGIVVWVAAIYLTWEVVVRTTGFDGSQLPLHGLTGVVVGALVGLVPGCAVQIAFTSLYLAGAAPLPTLVANAISQDGDALLPLLARNRRPAALATVLTTVPGLLVGAATLLWLG